MEGTLTTLGRVPADFSLAQTAGSVTSAITQHGYAVFDRASQTELYTIDLVSGAYTIGEMRGTGGGQANINYRYLANQNTFDLGGDDGGFNATLLINSNTVGLRYDSTANTWDLLGMDGTELVSGAADIAGGPVFQGSHLPPAPIAAVRTFSWIWEAVARSGAMSGTRFRIRGTLVTAGPDDAVISHASRVVGLGGSRDTSTNLGLLVEHTFAVYTVADNGNENEHSTFNLLQPAHTLSGEDVTPVYSGFNDYNYAIGADAFTIEDPDTLWFTLRTDTSLTDSAPLVGLIDRGGSGGWDLFAGTTTTAGNALANFPETPGPLITEGPAPVPPQAFTRTFRWIWQAGGYQVVGRFVTNARDGEVLLHANTGADSSILEHTYEVLPTGGDALFRINLLTNEYTDLATDITTTLASFVNYTHTVGFPVFGERSSTFTYAFSLGGSQRGLASVSGTGWRVVDSSNTILANYEVQNITSSPYLYFALEPYIQEGDAVPAYPAHYQWTWNITLNSPLSGGTTPTPVTYYFNGIFASAQTGVITADNAYWNAYNVGTTLDENDTSNNVLVAVNLHPVPNPGSDTWSPSAQSATTFRSAATDVSNFSYAPGADGFTINSSQPLDLRVQRGENSIGLVINAADNTINLYADNGSLILDSLPFDSADAPVVTRINA